MDERPTISEAIYAQMIGKQVIDFIKNSDLQKTEILARDQAILTLGKIRAILDNSDLDDPECFQKIEAIVEALGDISVSTTRHDW